MAPSSGIPSEISQEILAQLPALMAVASRLTKNRAEAEDLVQDTCLKAVRAWHQYEPGSNLKAWCLKILKNTFINRYRRDGLARSVMDTPGNDPVSDGWVGHSSLGALRDPESTAFAPMLRDELRRALDNIPEEFRIVVLLADVEELSYREIAETIGCPLGTVMSRLHRGRKQLKAQLQQHAAALGFAESHDTELTQTPESALEPAVSLNDFRRRKAGMS
ncbi:MAG TPA: sigma-70 family RNA polymerase sigma factor [Polyangiaceae bacterium]|nr:sigma-70 family RNA polymerase sigma factor [Polyangiaceae bacterium]